MIYAKEGYVRLSSTTPSSSLSPRCDSSSTRWSVGRTLFCGAFVALWLLAAFSPPLRTPTVVRERDCSLTLWSTTLDEGFEGFDNVSGVARGPYIVPNAVHFVRLTSNLANVSFTDAVNLLAAFKNLKPDRLYIHTDMPRPAAGRSVFFGKYWERLMRVPGFADKLQMRYIESIDSVFGQKLRPEYRPWHASDITRIRILMQYGGLIVDNDVYVVRSMDELRRYEMTIEYHDDSSIGMMVLMGHPGSRFAKLWLKGYRKYSPDWFYNAGIQPRKEILDIRPELVHLVTDKLGVKVLRWQLYTEKWKHWKSQYTIHLLIRSTHMLVQNRMNLKYPVTFDDTNIFSYNVTFLDMVLDCCRELLK